MPLEVAITIIAIFCLQGIVLSVLVLLKNRNRPANVFLGWVLIFFSLVTLNFTVFHSLVFLEQPSLIPYLQLELMFGIGPALFLYAKSMSDADYRMTRKDYLHFLPVLLEFIYYRTPLFHWGGISLTETPHNFYQILFTLVQWAGTLSISLYIFWAIKLLMQYHRWVQNNYSSLHHKNLRWLTQILLAYGVFWFVWFGLRLIDILAYADTQRNVYFVPLLTLLALLTFLLGFRGYIKTQMASTGFTRESSKTPSKDKPTKVNSPELLEITQQVQSIMEKEKLYLNSALDMRLLANKTGINSRQISQAINTELGVNFYEFVNRYRVDEFIKRIKGEQHQQMTLLGHALESGFASKSTFNHIFKKYTQLTPRQYYKQIWKEK